MSQADLYQNINLVGVTREKFENHNVALFNGELLPDFVRYHCLQLTTRSASFLLLRTP